MGSLLGNAAALSFFAKVLSARMDRLVVDKTNLSGRYDFRLQWRPGPGEMPDDGPADPGIDSRPSIFTALQEQMGLKLESARAPVEVSLGRSAWSMTRVATGPRFASSLRPN
jgi:uncharacterized protein (TIGR03435 family)